MVRVVRKGDRNNGGGRTLDGDRTFIVENRPVCPIHTPVSAHQKHYHARTAQGNKTYIINHKRITIVGNIDTCGHKRIEGARTFILGERFSS